MHENDKNDIQGKLYRKSWVHVLISNDLQLNASLNIVYNAYSIIVICSNSTTMGECYTANH